MRILVALLVISVIPLACGARAPIGAGPSATAAPTASLAPTPSPSADPEPAVRARATAAVTALRDKDFAALAALAHPVKGVRFTPYTFVQARDVVLDAATIRQWFTSTRTYTWGFTDGRGDAIDTNLEGYYKRYVYNKDYSKASPVIVDNYPPNRGNKNDNTKAMYPAGRTVEYYLPSTDPNTTLDWAGLRLVFEELSGTWYLVGIIHDEWTI